MVHSSLPFGLVSLPLEMIKLLLPKCHCRPLVKILDLKGWGLTTQPSIFWSIFTGRHRKIRKDHRDRQEWKLKKKKKKKKNSPFTPPPTLQAQYLGPLLYYNTNNKNVLPLKFWMALYCLEDLNRDSGFEWVIDFSCWGGDNSGHLLFCVQ